MDTETTHRQRLFSTACLEGDVTALRECLRQGFDPNMSLIGGSSPLLELCGGDAPTLEALRLLVEAGAKVGFVDAPCVESDRYTAFDLLCTRTGVELEAIRFMLDAGASARGVVRDEFSTTPLAYYCRENHDPAVIGLLLARGADPSMETGWYRSVDGLVRQGHFELALSLMDIGSPEPWPGSFPSRCQDGEKEKWVSVFRERHALWEKTRISKDLPAGSRPLSHPRL